MEKLLNQILSEIKELKVGQNLLKQELGNIKKELSASFKDTVNQPIKESNNGFSYFDQLMEQAKEEGRWLVRLDHLKSIVTKDIMKKHNWNDQDVMYLLNVDEEGYRKLHEELKQLLRDPAALLEFENKLYGEPEDKLWYVVKKTFSDEVYFKKNTVWPAKIFPKYNFDLEELINEGYIEKLPEKEGR